MRILCAATTPPSTLPCPAPTVEDQHVWISTHKTNLFIALLVLKNLTGSSQPPSTHQVPFSRTGPFQTPVTEAELTQPLRPDKDEDLVGEMAPTILASCFGVSISIWAQSCPAAGTPLGWLLPWCPCRTHHPQGTQPSARLPSAVRSGLRLQQRSKRLELVTWCKDAISIFRACFCP